jgi:hypothetical protein
VLDHGQHTTLGEVEQVGREEVAGQYRLGLRTQELPDGRESNSAGQSGGRDSRQAQGRQARPDAEKGPSAAAPGHQTKITKDAG